MNDFTLFDEHLFEVHRHIETHGYSVTGVIGTRTVPDYAYTIGLHLAGLPELAVIGDSWEHNSWMLRRVAPLMMRGGCYGVSKDEVHSCAGFACCLLPVPPDTWRPDSSPFCHITRYLEAVGTDVAQLPDDAVRQLVWGDSSGRMPWDLGVDAVARNDQPILSDGDAFERRVPLDVDPDPTCACWMCRARLGIGEYADLDRYDLSMRSRHPGSKGSNGGRGSGRSHRRGPGGPRRRRD